MLAMVNNIHLKSNHPLTNIKAYGQFKLFLLIASHKFSIHLSLQTKNLFLLIATQYKESVKETKVNYLHLSHHIHRCRNQIIRHTNKNGKKEKKIRLMNVAKKCKGTWRKTNKSLKIFQGENRLPLYTSVDKASEDRRNPRTLESPSPIADHPHWSSSSSPSGTYRSPCLAPHIVAD